jgi:hypothetical protein
VLAARRAVGSLGADARAARGFSPSSPPSAPPGSLPCLARTDSRAGACPPASSQPPPHRSRRQSYRPRWQSTARKAITSWCIGAPPFVCRRWTGTMVPLNDARLVVLTIELYGTRPTKPEWTEWSADSSEIPVNAHRNARLTPAGRVLLLEWGRGEPGPAPAHRPSDSQSSASRARK